MNHVEIYREINQVQRRDAAHVLEKYSKILKWKDTNENILDIGSGDGGVTTEILKKYIPSNFEKLIGFDSSEKMVNFANDHYKDNKSKFILFDIQSELPSEWLNNFDHIFSFYVFHWIKNMKAYENIYNLLNEKGECLLMFLGYMPIYNVFRELSHSAKWSLYLGDVENFVSSYHDAENPEMYIKDIMKNIGFQTIDVKCQRKSTIYKSIEALKGLITAINVFSIPDSLFQDFLHDFVTLIAENRIKDIRIKYIEESPQVLLNYDLIIVLGSK